MYEMGDHLCHWSANILRYKHIREYVSYPTFWFYCSQSRLNYLVFNLSILSVPDEGYSKRT